MTSSKSLFPAAAAAVTALFAAWACQAGSLVEDAWVRETVPHQHATGAYMKLNAAEDTVLVAASSPIAASVELHETTMDGDVMRMRPVPSLDLPAGQTVEARPGGRHFMLIGLKQPVRQGHTVPLTLVFQGRDGKRRVQEVKAEVRGIDGSAARPGPR